MLSIEICNHIISYLPPKDVANCIQDGHDEYILSCISPKKLKLVLEKYAFDNKLCTINPKYLDLVNLETCGYISIVQGHLHQFKMLWTKYNEEYQVKMFQYASHIYKDFTNFNRYSIYVYKTQYNEIIQFILDNSIPNHQYKGLYESLVDYRPNLDLFEHDVFSNLSILLGIKGCIDSFNHFRSLMHLNDVKKCLAITIIYKNTILEEYISSLYNLELPDMYTLCIYFTRFNHHLLDACFSRIKPTYNEILYMIDTGDGHLIKPCIHYMLQEFGQAMVEKCINDRIYQFIYNDVFDIDMCKFITEPIPFQNTLLLLQNGHINIVQELYSCNLLDLSPKEIDIITYILNDDSCALNCDIKNLYSIALKCNLINIVKQFPSNASKCLLKFPSIEIINHVLTNEKITHHVIASVFDKNDKRITNYFHLFDDHLLTFIYWWYPKFRHLIPSININDLYKWTPLICINEMLDNVNFNWLGDDQSFDFQKPPKSIHPPNNTDMYRNTVVIYDNMYDFTNKDGKNVLDTACHVITNFARFNSILNHNLFKIHKDLMTYLYT